MDAHLTTDAPTRQYDESGYPLGRRDLNCIWAQRVIRAMTKTAAAQEIGPTAYALVALIAAQEDAKRYRAPVTFYNDQLMPLLGVRKWDTLDHARKKAVEYGWLHYTAPPRGVRSVPGVYWSLIPDGLDGLHDAAIDEGQTVDDCHRLWFTEGYRAARLDKKRPTFGQAVSDSWGQSRDSWGDSEGEPSYPLPETPNPEEKRESADADAPAELLALIGGWNELGKGIVKPGNGARRDPPAEAVLQGWKRVQGDREARAAFENIPVLLAAIGNAKFCHGQGWFTLPWLLGKNRNTEWSACRLLAGAYDSEHDKGNNRNGPRTHEEYEPDGGGGDF